jgi:ABC-type nickel/cobalt efflux system permease component RcnA
MWLLFVPILILLVLVLTVGALFQGVFWLVGGAWPWLLIGLGAWLFWHQDGRHYRRRHEVRRPSRSLFQQRPQKISQTAIRTPMRTVPELPIDVRVKVEQIRRKVDVLLGYADRFPPFSQDLHLVRQTASDYLPRTLNAFLALKPEDIDKPLSGTGKTARQELRSQLDLLDQKLDDIAQDLQRQDADRLLANRRFLEARFGARDAANVSAPTV